MCHHVLVHFCSGSGEGGGSFDIAQQVTMNSARGFAREPWLAFKLMDIYLPPGWGASLQAVLLGSAGARGHSEGLVALLTFGRWGLCREPNPLRWCRTDRLVLAVAGAVLCPHSTCAGAAALPLPPRGFPPTPEHIGIVKCCEMRFMLPFIFPENEDSEVQEDWIPGIRSPSLGFTALWGAPIGGLAGAVLPRSLWLGR